MWINIHSELSNKEISDNLHHISSIRFTGSKDEKSTAPLSQASISQTSGLPHSNLQVIPYDELLNTEKMGTNDPSQLETNTKKRPISQVEPKPEDPEKRKTKKTATKAKASGNMSIKSFFSKASS